MPILKINKQFLSDLSTHKQARNSFRALFNTIEYLGETENDISLLITAPGFKPGEYFVSVIAKTTLTGKELEYSFRLDVVKEKKKNQVVSVQFVHEEKRTFSFFDVRGIWKNGDDYETVKCYRIQYPDGRYEWRRIFGGDLEVTKEEKEILEFWFDESYPFIDSNKEADDWLFVNKKESTKVYKEWHRKI